MVNSPDCPKDDAAEKRIHEHLEEVRKQDAERRAAIEEIVRHSDLRSDEEKALDSFSPIAMERLREAGHPCEEVIGRRFRYPTLEITCISVDGGPVVTYMVSNFGTGAIGIKK